MKNRIHPKILIIYLYQTPIYSFIEVKIYLQIKVAKLGSKKNDFTVGTSIWQNETAQFFEAS